MCLVSAPRSRIAGSCGFYVYLLEVYQAVEAGTVSWGGDGSMRTRGNSRDGLRQWNRAGEMAKPAPGGLPSPPTCLPQTTVLALKASAPCKAPRKAEMAASLSKEVFALWITGAI